MSRLSKVRLEQDAHRQTNGQTQADRQTRPNTLPTAIDDANKGAFLSSGGDRKFHWGGGGYSPEICETETPTGVQRRSPGRGPEGQSATEAEAICRHCLHILTAETIKVDMSAESLVGWYGRV